MIDKNILSFFKQYKRLFLEKWFLNHSFFTENIFQIIYVSQSMKIAEFSNFAASQVFGDFFFNKILIE